MTRQENKTYSVLCGDRQVASVSGPDDFAQTEAFRYAGQYRHEGRVTIKCGRELVAILSQISPIPAEAK